MRYHISVFAVAAALVMGLTSISVAAHADGELHVYTFGDYFSPDAIKKFGDEEHVKVTVDTYDSNDQMLAKITAGGSGYDIALAGNWYVPEILKKGLAMKVEPNTFENYKNVRPEFKNVWWDDGRHYTVPFLWGTTGFSINTKMFNVNDAKNAPYADSWALVFSKDSPLHGSINAIPEQEDVINAVSFYKHIPLCSDKKDDLKLIEDTLAEAHTGWRSYDYGVVDGMAKGNWPATMNWNGSSMRSRILNPDVKYVYPKEGLASWFDSVFVVKDAKNIDNAKKFMNFLMKPENAAMLTNFAGYDNGISDTTPFLKKEYVGAPELNLPDGAKPNFVPACSPEVSRMHGLIFTKIKS